MIIFGNKKASKLEVCGANGSPNGWQLSTRVDPRSRLRLWQTATANSAAGSTYRLSVSTSARPNWTRLVVSWETTAISNLLLSRGERLPFADHSFDMVVTSAVILHNPPAIAERIRREVMRVTRRFAAHNEETNLSYNRYGYDTALWYRRQGIVLAESGPIPMDPDPSASQFCVAVIDPGE